MGANVVYTGKMIMSIKYYIVSYIRHLKRGENRNVGLIMVNDDTTLSRFLGYEGNGIFEPAVLSELGLDQEVYTSWIRYYTKNASSGSLPEVLSSRTLRTPNFLLKEGEILVTDDPLDVLFENLFHELIA